MATHPHRSCVARLPGGELRVLGAHELKEIDGLRSQADTLVYPKAARPYDDVYPYPT